jgi:hypothetical protein
LSIHIVVEAIKVIFNPCSELLEKKKIFNNKTYFVLPHYDFEITTNAPS